MDIGSILLILALLLLVGLYVSRPFVNRAVESKESTLEASAADHERSALLAERDRILNALQELDFDYALGKIPEEDYPEQRARLLAKGADVLRQLDSLMSGSSEDAETRLEAAVAARRADSGQVAIANGRKLTPGGDDELEKMLADRRRARTHKAAGFCPQCGGPVQKSDRFCPKCGGKIDGAAVGGAKVGGRA